MDSAVGECEVVEHGRQPAPDCESVALGGRVEASGQRGDEAQPSPAVVYVYRCARKEGCAMKMPAFPLVLSCNTVGLQKRRHRKDGIAVIVVLALIVMVLLFVMGNVRTFYSLDRELKLLEKQQMHRMQVTTRAVVTNAVVPVEGNNAGVRSGKI